MKNQYRRMARLSVSLPSGEQLDAVADGHELFGVVGAPEKFPAILGMRVRKHQATENRNDLFHTPHPPKFDWAESRGAFRALQSL
jgi:hypothetical protein